MAKLVSKTYGDALFDLAVEQQTLDAMLEEVKAVSAAMADSEELTGLMNHPKIVKDDKIKLIEDIFAQKVSRELVGLMRMIVEKGHYNEMQSVFSYFINRVKEYRNIGTAYVTSAIPLSDAQKAAVEARLLETTKYVTFEMHYDVDADLIGGMVIRIGDRVMDSSIRTKLHSLTRELSQIQLKVGECAP